MSPASPATPTSQPPSATTSTPPPPRASAPATSQAPHPATHVTLPAPGLAFDYQIGGPYTPPPGVRAVSRDRTAPPVPGLYNICYVNAFQAQPDALDWWTSQHPNLLLHDATGSIVMDTDWNEALLDVSTDAKRTALADIVGGWIDGCAKAGFQAVEPDNLDSYSRSDNTLTPADDIAFARLLSTRAHADGLAIAQKNAAELTDTDRGIFDFAIAEECTEYDECGTYAAAYDNRVFVVEYQHDTFDAACHTWSGKLSVVLRDRDVTPPDDPAHVYAAC